METKNYVLICLASALMIGYTYGFDLPQALELPLREEPFNFSNMQFNLLYFFQFLPDILFQIPIGILVDKYPLKRLMYFFTILCFISLLASGLVFQSMVSGYKYIIYLLRSIFGVSGEALFTVQAVLLTLYAGHHYEVSMGICLSLPFVFDALNSIVTTHVFDATKNMALTWYIAAFIAFLSIITAIWIDKIYLRKKTQEENSKQQNSPALNINSSTTVEISEQLIVKQENEGELSSQSEEEEFNCKSIFNLSSQFWVLCGAIFFFQAALGPYFDNMNDMIVKRFGIDYTDAGKMLILPQALLVLFGYGISKICSKKPYWRRKILLIMSISYLVLISIVYFLPNTKQPTPIYYVVICVYLLLMSMMFACEYCALVGSTSYFVPKSQLGTAYGVAATALCACQCLGPLVNAAILDLYEQLDKSYELLSLFGVGLAVFPVIFALWMYQKEFQILDYNLKDDFVQNRLKKKEAL